MTRCYGATNQIRGLFILMFLAISARATFVIDVVQILAPTRELAIHIANEYILIIGTMLI